MKQPEISMVMEAPKNWFKMLENIRRVRQKYPAPVDSMGCDQAQKSSGTTREKRYQVLVSLMLSSQTKDPITWAATQKLKDNNMCNADGLLEANEKEIEDLIYPVGFYKRKAVYLKKAAAILKEQYDGDIPDSIEELCKLPGVGLKMAHLCMQEAWNVNSGIGVDTHVHRISARLGWVPSKNVKTPEHTRQALESWLPSEYWREINHLLVGFGQTICTPLRPRCSDCDNNDVCPSATIAPTKKKEEQEQAPSGPTEAVARLHGDDATRKRRKKNGLAEEEGEEVAVMEGAKLVSSVKQETDAVPDSSTSPAKPTIIPKRRGVATAAAAKKKATTKIEADAERFVAGIESEPEIKLEPKLEPTEVSQATTTAATIGQGGSVTRPRRSCRRPRQDNN